MNIDLLCEFGSLNGGENSILALLPLLRRRGIEFRIVAPPAGPFADRIRELDFELVPIHCEPGSPLAVRRETLEKTLWRIQSRFFHANSLSMGRLSGPFTRFLRTPSIAHLRDIVRLNRSMVSDLNQHRRLLAVSEATRQFHINQGISPERCYVLFNGVDLEQFRPRLATGYLHREWKIPSKSRLLAVIGQIGLRKGQDLLLEALEPVFRRHDDVHLLIVGRRWSEKEESIRFEENLRIRSQQAPFSDRVHFLGVRTDIPELLSELTLLLHPARQEPLGRVLLEAAACGTATVATDVGGTREIFPDAPESARIVLPASSEAIAAAVCELLDSTETIRAMSVKARARAESAFSREGAAEALFLHYQAVWCEI